MIQNILQNAEKNIVENPIQKESNFIYPDICKEVPKLICYCDEKYINVYPCCKLYYDNNKCKQYVKNAYHCNKLSKLMFREVNIKYSGNILFDYMTHDIPKYDIDAHVSHHIYELMNGTENIETIHGTVNEFKNKCIYQDK